MYRRSGMKKLIVANWKMNGNIHKLACDLNEYINNPKTNADNIVLGLPNTLLATAYTQLQTHNIKLAAQNISHFGACGAYTGEVNAAMLKDVGAQYVIIGHSERREYFAETDTTLQTKLQNAITDGLIPIFCVGESEEKRDSGNYSNFVTKQLNILSNLDVEINEIVIAYEPIWAIGTGRVPTLEQIQEMGTLIHAFAHENLRCGKITVLYGGSVSPNNVKDILSLSEINGVLVGGASLKVSDFKAVCAHGSC